jgi:2-dehydro-3-deoxyphosphogluconate aldolase / (4S)-4-hydroxy-2-oxoglutarate aldolase
MSGDTLALIESARIVPVVVIDDPGTAPGLVGALADGGIGCAEITLRTEAGLEAIRRASAADRVLVGAGTVLTPEQVDASVEAGARFIVTPGFDDDVVDRAARLGVPIVPGVATAGEVQRALRRGVDHLKLFPAGVLGGLAMIGALSGPFPGVRFVPSGGVTAANAAEYLASPAVFAVSGSWMVPRSAVRESRFDEIASLSAEAMAAVRA